MRFLASALLGAAIAAQAAVASPIRARSPYVMKEEHYAPREYTKLDRANGESAVHLQIGLKQGNMKELIRHLHEGKVPSCVNEQLISIRNEIPRYEDRR